MAARGSQDRTSLPTIYFLGLLVVRCLPNYPDDSGITIGLLAFGAYD